MTKHPAIWVVSLTVLVLIVSCSSTKPEPIETPVVEPNEVEPNQIEPEQVEYPKVEPNEVEPNKVEPTKADTKQIEPEQTEPAKVEPNEVVPNKVVPAKPKPARKVSFHDKCADILTSFVDDKGMVNYKELRRKRLELKKLLDEFTKLDPDEYKSWPKKDKIALWINAYNIKMLDILVDNYPIQSSRILRLIWGPYSIRHVDKSIGGILKQKFIVMDEEFTLTEVEQRFFRKEFDEPRVFFGLSRASLSSPPLRNEPYYGYKLDKQLDDQAKKFLSSPLAFKIDKDERKVYLSAILKPSWFGREFISKYGTDKRFKDQPPATRAVLNFITNYVSRQEVSFLEIEIYSVEYMNYDWTINDSSIR